jgi:hypothetical protein
MGSMIDAAVNLELGLAARGEVTWSREAGGWTMACGLPLMVNGDPVDYARSRLAEFAEEGLVDDSFCALFEATAEGLVFREFDIGSTDAPFLGWMEIYDLPASLIAVE